jgi:hypothetical protein
MSCSFLLLSVGHSCRARHAATGISSFGRAIRAMTEQVVLPDARAAQRDETFALSD